MNTPASRFGTARPDPTHEEIRAACDQLQSTWSAHEHKRRRVGEYQGWQPPLVRCDRELTQQLPR